MSIQAASLIATISVIGADQAKADLASTGAAADAAGKNLQGAVAMGAAVAGVALVALAAKSVNMAATFQSGMTSLVTGAGELKSNLGLVSNGILQMAVDTGTSTAQLTSGMYMIESAGYHGAAGLAVLQAAAEGAKVGNADLGAVANALTTVLTDYHLPATAAAAATSALIQTVADGKTHLQDLAGSMGSVLPLASALHISFPQVAGAIAVMTNAGMDAQRASMNLANAIRALSAPNKAAEKAMASVGLSAQQLKDTLSQQGLTGVIQLIEQHINKTFPAGSVQAVSAFKALMGGATGYNVALMLGGQNMSAFEGNVANISAAIKSGSKDVQGWADVQKDFNFKLSQAQEVAETLGIKIGTALLPVVGNLVSGLANLVPKIADWMQKTNAITPILAGLGAMLISMVAPAIWSVAAGVIAATWPFLAIGVAVGGLVAIFQHFYSTNAGFKSFIDGLVNGLKQAASFVQANFLPAMQQIGSFLSTYVWPILQQVGSFIASQFAPVWQQLVQLWNSQLLPAFKQLMPALQQMMPLLQLIGIIIGGIVVVSIGILIGLISGLAKGIAYMVEGLSRAVGGIVQFFTGIAQIVGGIVQFIVDLIHGNFSKLVPDLQQIGQGAINVFTGMWNTIAGIFQAAWGLISGIVGGFVQGVITFFTHLWSELVGHSIIPDMWNSIVQWFTSMPQRILGTILNFVSMLLARFNELKSAAIVIFESLVQGIGNAFSKLGGLAQSAWQNAAGAIKGGINTIIGLINGFINGVDKIHITLPGGQSVGFSIPDIPYLASGGSVTQSGMAIVGENGPEQVWLPAGAQVIPNNQAFGQQPQIVVQPAPVYLDGRQLMNGLMPYFTSAVRYGTGAKF